MAHYRSVWSAFVLAGALALTAAACEDPCGGGDTECLDETSLLFCQTFRDGFAVSHEWETQACTAFNPVCVAQEVDPNVVPQRHGVCVSSDVVSPMCISNPDGYCTGDVRYGCSNDGYAIVVESCANGCAVDANACMP